MSGALGRRGFFVWSPFAFWGSSLSKDLVVKLQCWLAALRGVGGALGCASSGKSGCPLCFVDASERGVSPRLEVGGVSLFCAGFALSRLRLICFEARLSGYCVREGGGQGSQPWVLVLAFSRGSGKTSAGRGLLHGHVDFGL